MTGIITPGARSILLSGLAGLILHSAAKAEPAPETLQYARVISAHLQRFKHFPDQAKAGRKSGHVVVSFTLDPQGHVTASKIARSSCEPVFDAEALETVKRADPFPAFPAAMEQVPISFAQPLHYKLAQAEGEPPVADVDCNPAR